MATEEQIEAILETLELIPRCQTCGTRLRFGDRECPRCGDDIEDLLRAWATALIDRLGV